MAAVSLLTIIGGAGCATVGPAPPSSPDHSAAQSPPAASLLAEAGVASAANDHDRAAALVERAMRIDPRNAGLYLELARIRMRQGLPAQAEGIAMRAIALAPGDRHVSEQAWRIVADARDRQGDTAGAAAAREAGGSTP